MQTYRVLVSTDLGGDPDDIQSLYRIIHYSDILKIEGITSVPGPDFQTPRAELVREWIKRVDVDHLRSRGYTDLMSEQELLDCVKQGAQAAGAPSAERSTDGSKLIIERAMAPSDEPLWVLVWGSITDIAQALHDEPQIASRIRIYYIGSSNTEGDPASREFVYQFMENEYPELWWIENGILPKGSRDTFRGVYQSGLQEEKYHFTKWINAVIRGKGTTHNGLFAEKCGDAFPVAHWPADSLKEGDSPTFLYLLSPVIGGVGDVDDPTCESWGGQFQKPHPERFPNYYGDLEADAATCQATIGKWRKNFLDHWEDRWQRYGE